MRTILIGFLLISVMSCKKDLGSTKSEIVGTWEYERYSGFPFNIPALPPGNGKIIVIGDDGLYERKQQDTLLFRGSYSLNKKKDCHPTNSTVTFSTSENPGSFAYVEISEGKLLLSSSNCNVDGGTSIYIRIK